MDERYVRLRELLGEIWDISKASAILGWDQQTKMPPRGAAGRAEQLATLGRIAHEKFTSAEIGSLLDELQGFEESQPYDSVEASLIRVTRHDWDKARRVPAELRAELTRSASLALPVWAEARQNSDFQSFLPHLEQHPLLATPFEADIHTMVSGLKDLSPRPWPERFRMIQAAGGHLDIVQSRVQQGEVIAARYGDEEEYRVLHPSSFEGKFSLL